MRHRSSAYCLTLLALALGTATAQSRPPAVNPNISAPISNVHYDVTFDSSTARTRSLKVQMTFGVDGTGAVLLSLPDWTPGAYEISNFARWVSEFDATADSKP